MKSERELPKLNFKMADMKRYFENKQDIQLYYDADSDYVDFCAPNIGSWFELADSQKTIGFLKHTDMFGSDKFVWKKQDILQMVDDYFSTKNS